MTRHERNLVSALQRFRTARDLVAHQDTVQLVGMVPEWIAASRLLAALVADLEKKAALLTGGGE